MKHYLRHFILISFLVTAATAQTQNLTGCWQGLMDGEYMEVNIEQRGNDICGYTYDYELDNPSGHCKANFEGRYIASRNTYFLDGTSFLENSGTHVLMRILLWHDKDDDNNILRGKVYINSTMMSIFGKGGDDLTLKKVSSRPKKTAGKTFPCFPPKIKEPAVKNVPEKKVTPQPVTPKPAQPKPAPVKVKTVVPVKAPAVKKDPVLNADPKPVAPITVTKRPPSQLEKLMTERKQHLQSRVTVDVKEIKLKLYDNGTVDNDTVSIFYNGRLLLSHQRLSEKAIELTIALDESVTQHEITLFAENLGTIPPNTALVVVTAGSKRFELHSKANMEENAVLIFDYKPK
ncbi:hypothetical protein BH11BAC4_BH11BAC4_21620 [soil metagenome]